MPSDVPTPAPLGGIRNAAWLNPFALWRGEQPPLDDDTVAAMRQSGIQVIFSLAHGWRARRPVGRPTLPGVLAGE